MASTLLSNATMLTIAVASIGQIPPVQVDEATGETTIQGTETEKIVTAASYHTCGGSDRYCCCCFRIALFIFVAKGLVDFMSICVVLMASVVTVQKHLLSKLGGFRAQHNILRLKVGRLHLENEKLTPSVSAFSFQTCKLQQVEQDLQSTAVTSEKSVDKLVAVVEENGKIQKEIRENWQAQVMQQIMSAVLQTDSACSFIVTSAKEVEVLVMRLKNLPGVVFAEIVFRSILKSDVGELTLMDVCGIARHLKDSGHTIATAATTGGLTSAAEGCSTDATSRSIGETAMKTASSIFQFQPKDILKQRK